MRGVLNYMCELVDKGSAVELDPNYEKAHAHHINAIADTGEVRKALAMLKDLTEKFPNSCFIYNAYAKVLCMNKQPGSTSRGPKSLISGRESTGVQSSCAYKLWSRTLKWKNSF
ncbi:hypothetical protein BGZ52_002192 [Haplosporangium bisporale]|nr:hypothetical protein BGZ52_002192 [Haplosporangium bisporale]